MMTGLTVLHFYAFMVHHYNRIVARDAMSRLPPEAESPTRTLNSDGHGWRVDSGLYKTEYFVMFNMRNVGPTFASEHEAKQFQAFLERKYKSDQSVFDAIYHEKIKQDHLQFRGLAVE